MSKRLEPTQVDPPDESDSPGPRGGSVAPPKGAVKVVEAIDASESTVRLPHDPALDKLRVSIARVIQRYFAPLFLVTLFCVGFLFIVISFGLFQESAINVMALAASVQVAFGMIIGFVCVYIGLMMTWFGIDAAYTLKGSFDAGAAIKSEGALKSASPGLLFALGGMMLIAVSLYKPIVFEEKGGLPVRVGRFPRGDEPSGSDTIVPNAPPPRPKTND